VIKKPRKRRSQNPLLGCENTTTMGCNARKTNKQTIIIIIIIIIIIMQSLYRPGHAPSVPGV
jgi:t-SNARE complex subunit (syntaxin)